MVNIEKLNSTINDLELKSKEIDSLVDKQKKLDILAKEIDELRNTINNDKLKISEIVKETNKLISTSKDRVIETDRIIENRFSNIKDILNSNNQLLNNYLDKINDLNDNVVKKLNEIIIANNKAINDYHNVLNTQINILKSEVQLQFRTIDDSLNVKINNENQKIISIIDKLENKIIEFNNRSLKSDKSTKILLIITAILSISTFILVLIK